MHIPLRNGSATTDRRLDRIPNLDPRSRAYAAAENQVINVNLEPRTKVHICPIRMNQGNEGKCVCYAECHAAASFPVSSRVSTKVADVMYDWCQANDQWPGNAYSGTDVVSGLKWMVDHKAFDSYHMLRGAREAALANDQADQVVLVGTNWKTGMHTPDKLGVIHYRGSISGGHSYLNVGAINVAADPEVYAALNMFANSGAIVMDLVKRYNGHRLHAFINSWGLGWGLTGAFFMLGEDFDECLADQGEAYVILKENKMDLAAIVEREVKPEPVTPPVPVKRNCFSRQTAAIRAGFAARKRVLESTR